MVVKGLLALCLTALPATVLAQAAANPWFGTWELRLNQADEPPETLVYRDAGDGAMRMESVEQGSVIVTRFDGTPSPDIGSNGRREPALAIKATSPTSYTWTFYRAGKPFVEGVNTLSGDGKSFSEVSWLITKPGSTITHIYERK